MLVCSALVGSSNVLAHNTVSRAVHLYFMATIITTHELSVYMCMQRTFRLD